MAAPAARAFRTGTKQVFLPDHVITLLRPRPGRREPANFATFKVPLRFNKLDMRDYLLHAYNVNAVKVHSSTSQRMPQRNKLTGRIGRPPPIKYMMVEMTQPFVWPPEPDEKTREEAWETKETKKRVKVEEDFERRKENYVKRAEIQSKAKTKPSPERKMLRKQAQDLLDGKVEWENKRSLDPRWTDTKV